MLFLASSSSFEVLHIEREPNSLRLLRQRGCFSHAAPPCSVEKRKQAMEELIGSGNIMEKQVRLKISFFSVLKMRRASHENVYTAMDVSSWKATAKSVLFIRGTSPELLVALKRCDGRFISGNIYHRHCWFNSPLPSR